VPSTDAQLTILPGIKAGEYAAVKNLSGTGMLTVAANGTLEITGSFTGAGLAASPLSALILSGGEQAIPTGSYGSLVLKGTGPKELAGAVFIANSLDLQQGHLYLASHNLTVAKAARILNFSPASYLVTNGTGSLKINSIGAETILFPIGTALSYTPASLSNYGVTDNFSMRVEEGFYLDSKGGTYLSEGAVNKTWHVEEEVTGGSDVSMTFQWNASDELANFARTESFASHYENNQWNKVANSQGTLADGSTVHTYTISMHGITSFSPFGVSSTENSYGPLPVSLSKFTAKRQGNETVLEWETASEQGNKGFYVELSADGKQFRKLGFVASKAVNSQVALHYSYRDTEAGKQGTRYYRLQQVDLDGTTSYSPVKAVEFTPEPVTLAVYPNPFSSRVTVALESLRAQQLYLSLTDSQGKVLLEKAEAVSAGINDVPLDLSHVNPKGLFILTVRYGEVTHHVKLLRH
ncbi:MAG: T9SS type A sorting domain-containing protein, partial [Hymenobacteraceae bacterium]|nr:T9SS type A sorting domain-containing protein [Hymenobacteraceae bacterium]